MKLDRYFTNDFLYNISGKDKIVTGNYRFELESNKRLKINTRFYFSYSLIV